MTLKLNEIDFYEAHGGACDHPRQAQRRRGDRQLFSPGGTQKGGHGGKPLSRVGSSSETRLGDGLGEGG